MQAEPQATTVADPSTAALAEAPALPPSSGAIPGFEMLSDAPPQGLLRRFLTTQRHLFALILGGLVAHAWQGQALGKGRRLRALFSLERLLAWLVRPFLDRGIVDRPFPVQLRRRLEILGPTYIKLGQEIG